jgi:hypothetical protein
MRGACVPKRISALAVGGWLAVSVGGCASLTGLDSIHEMDCAPGCVTAIDTPEGSTGSAHDVAQGEPPEEASRSDASDAAVDAPAEASPDASAEAAPDTPAEASPDTTEAATASEGGVDGGCVAVLHIVGAGLPGAANADFYDCTPVGTYTSQLAMDACAAYFGTASDCDQPGSCGGTADFVVCGQATPSSECICWEYLGPYPGKVTAATGAQLGQCMCPSQSGSGLTTYSWQ